MDNTETKFNFLIAAISDAQEIIRFIETKAAVATILLGGILALMFAELQNICTQYCSYPAAIQAALWMTIVCINLSIYCLIRIIMPIGRAYGEGITPRFYLSSTNRGLKHYLFPQKLEIKLPIEEYQSQIAQSADDNLIMSLTCELYSVSYVREVKSRRLKNLLAILLITAIIFIITLVMIKSHVS